MPELRPGLVARLGSGETSPGGGRAFEVMASQLAGPLRVAVDEVMILVEARQAARARRDWAAADALRERLAATGWSVQDTPEGPRLEPAKY